MKLPTRKFLSRDLKAGDELPGGGPVDDAELLAEIVSLKGIRFDPLVVEAFMQEKENFLQIAQMYSDAP